jgi:anti-sigma factor RsiW
MSCPHRFDVAPYALGTLDPAEREHVAAHMPACPECQAVLESVAGLPGLLARVEVGDIEPSFEAPDEAMFSRLLARSAEAGPSSTASGGSEQAARSGASGRAPGRPLVLAVAAAVLAVLTLGVGWAVHIVRQDSGVRVVTAAAGPVHATVRISPTPTGTSFRLDLAGVESEQECRLVAVDRAGRRTLAASWEAGYEGTATFDASVPIPEDRLAWLRIETDRATLVTFRVS